MGKSYFKEYVYAKVALNSLVCQFYSYTLDKKQADKLGIIYNNDSIKDPFGKLLCVYHGYNPEGLYLWEKLGIEEPIVLIRKLWEYRIKDEEKKDNIDYHREYLELKMIIASMVNRYYSNTTDLEDMKRNKFEYDEIDLDEETNRVDTCDHYFETAGEQAFMILGIKTPIITRSNMYKITESLRKEILEIDCEKVKKMGVKHE